MDQDHPRRRRRRRSGEDHISGLPDELLHSILLRLGSARAAARTCALSRRWRRVWAHLPELVFGSGSRDAPPLAPASFARGVGGVARSVDGALAAYAADTTLEGLVIVLPTAACDALDGVPAGRVARWLRFAAGRVAGELILFMPPPTMPPHEPEGVHWAALELPACERARTIALRLRLDWRLRLPPAGSFAALTSLTILFACMDGGELTAHVCTRCPCMRNLRLCLVLVDDHGVSIRSDSLRSLSFVARARWLEVVTPGLEYLCVGEDIGEARVSAPKLAGLVWSCHATYDPHRHRFEDAGRRRLQLLDIGETSAAGLLLRKFEGVEVDQLRLGVSIPLGIEAYKSFSNETSKLPKCQTLNITLLPRNCHGLAPVMLHLLRSCSSTKKVSVQLFDFSGYSSMQCTNPQKVGLQPYKVVFEKVRSMCHPKIEVEFYDFMDGAWVRFD
ncbi:hypothetical protein C2845_PM18G09760 [Panicum miliaceum]|uniref:F-box domain-containing protein n=1 Tax=Panicum miliaceum TaxID=4540 RepID=A0A3L6PKF4_PANMI|nr:hypothetical protein C2845_PM18G09760 [Panicum miliaceum]